MKQPLIVAALLVLLSTLWTHTIEAATGVRTREVKGRLLVPETRDVASVIGVDTEVTLDFGRYKAGVRRDGGFIIRNVPSGTYILEVVSATHAFDRLWIEVDTAEGIVRASQYIPAAEYDPLLKRTVPYPVELTAKGQYEYFHVREGFNYMALLQNPMMLMAVASIAMIYLLPKMMEGIPPEELQASREAQARMFGGGARASGGPAQPAANIDIAEQLARWSTGGSSK
ncbi:hypothetical protein M427DRAFT_138792 [Gonapodya prolifera JEL478]|uniref:ER membrane protein complex subunit 7 beta-sandwich domain-containing protein n=1 Tax=Gonapodya prolifera (strain JEL478) TaxID=1344416 RepID=A0A139A2A7_GONPJ|nr:hypothetical protein M427DRAFT_138792 [Gonapodya prolifera JEL478]|eukprot:KXS10881.1 hypothetical protein M427DRAFT_138792 [Gonapodya prolifera JEL478]